MLCSRSAILISNTRRSRAEADPVELRHPVDEARDVEAEFLLDLDQAELGVLDGVVQQGRRYRHVVHAELGQDRGDGCGMGDEGVARAAHLPRVGVLSHLVGAFDQLHVGARAPGSELLDDLVDTQLRGSRRSHLLEHGLDATRLRIGGAAVGLEPVLE